MKTNLERYKKDLEKLVEAGVLLSHAMQYETHREAFEKQVTKRFGEEKAATIIAELPSFTAEYQSWYSEAKALIRQVLPDRLSDFERLYEKPKSRKEITYESYRIEDYLQTLSVNRTVGWEKEKVVGPEAAIPLFRQQRAIVESVKARFESTLFDIRQLVQADLLDSELDAAHELARKGFGRAAGAVAGVVLERHLAQVCGNHAVSVSKKNACISDLNDALKSSGVIDVPQWRFVQHLADVRNLCDHAKGADPTAEQVNDLILGVQKVTKTLY